MISNVKVKVNARTKSTLLKLPDKIVHAIALETLNKTTPTIPVSSALEHNSTRGRLRRETVAKGVQKNGKKYFLESPTYYSNYVYNMNDSTTKWSTPNTHSEWFLRTWKKEGKTITESSVRRYKL